MQPGGSAGSVSRLQLEIDVSNRGIAACEIVRHLAPITSGSIMKNLPLKNRFHRYADDFVYFETGLVIGAEKQKSRFKRGEMGFMVSNGSLCIFLKESGARPMNPLGHVTANLELIEASHPGDVLTLRRTTA